MTNNTTRVTIDAGGQLCIGNTVPLAKLHVQDGEYRSYEGAALSLRHDTGPPEGSQVRTFNTTTGENTVTMGTSAGDGSGVIELFEKSNGSDVKARLDADGPNGGPRMASSERAPRSSTWASRRRCGEPARATRSATRRSSTRPVSPPP